MNDYQRIEAIIHYLDQHRYEQPNLDTIAAFAGLSPSHLQRLFSRWAGVSPKAFLKCLNLVQAKRSLHAGNSVLETSLQLGLSGPGRLHDLCVSLEAASPDEIKSGGQGVSIVAGVGETPFGRCLIATTDRGICHLSFLPLEATDQRSCLPRPEPFQRIHDEWPKASIQSNSRLAQRTLDGLFTIRPPATEATTATMASRPHDAPDVTKPTPAQLSSTRPLKALVKGTAFQIRVWRALLELPIGSVTSYSHLAASIGKPSATRAVASAVARNEIAYLIPCHRVIRKTGVTGQYRWGPTRKIAMLAWEACAHG